MLRILVLCARDWQHPRATGVERYVYEVFRRVAAEGNYVAWLCQNHGGIPLIRPQSQTLEQVGGIQIARLGAKALYRAMTGLFFSRMTGSDGVLRQFDVIVDCVTGRPFPVAKYTTTPLVPVVFRLSPGLRASDGPIVAPTEQSCRELREAGVPSRHIIRAPFGCTEYPHRVPIAPTEAPTLAAFVNAAQPLSRALRRLSDRRADSIKCTVVGPTRGFSTGVEQSGPVRVDEIPVDALERAWVAYCGEGCEWRALDFANLGVPIVCPDTPEGQEIVRNGETGLLHRSRDSVHLAEVLDTVLQDEFVRRRLANQARERAREASWDRTASLVLAALENLCYSENDQLTPVPSL